MTYTTTTIGPVQWNICREHSTKWPNTEVIPPFKFQSSSPNTLLNRTVTQRQNLPISSLRIYYNNTPQQTQHSARPNFPKQLPHFLPKSKEKEIHHSCNFLLSQNFNVNHILYVNGMVFESINSLALSLLYGTAPLPESTCAHSYSNTFRCNSNTQSNSIIFQGTCVCIVFISMLTYSSYFRQKPLTQRKETSLPCSRMTGSLTEIQLTTGNTT